MANESNVPESKDKKIIEREKQNGVLMLANTGLIKGYPVPLAQKVLDKSKVKGLWNLHPEEDRFQVNKSGKIVEKK